MNANVRGIEHVGITVPDIAAGERFFEQAFGAAVLYRLVPRDGKDVPGSAMERSNGLSRDNAMRAVTMMRLGNGPNVELFEMATPTGEGAPVISDLGVNHFSVYVEDIETAAAAARQAGGELLEGPLDTFAQEKGAGNRVWFLTTPWGSLIELITLPSPMRYDGPANRQRLVPLPV